MTIYFGKNINLNKIIDLVRGGNIHTLTNLDDLKEDILENFDVII